MAEPLTPTANCNPGHAAGRRERAEQLVDAIVCKWLAGEAPCAERYVTEHPELQEEPEAAFRLIYEEICLRREAGEEGVAAAVLARFPQWREELQSLLLCHEALGAPAPPREPDWPLPGETLGEFRLLTEIGRGVEGRVYLATQPALADRPVVVKLTPRKGREHQALARAQHTHIMPLYGVREDLARDLRLLCMPYFGGATLSRVLRELQRIPPGRRSGRDLVHALDTLQDQGPLPLPGRGPARERLARCSHADAVCLLGICLADALEYAHERGLVHLDVKPSNVLLSAEAQPLLLDFHLACPPLKPGGALPDSVGGTPGYMAPEQQAAFNALKTHRPLPATVDGRADVYGLGMVLYEALAGAAATAVPPPPLYRVNAQVSRGLSDLVNRCLAPDPARRYPRAAALAADLRRHLAGLPLRGVANRSWAERWAKWRRRRPYALVLTVTLVAALAAGLVFGLGWLGQRHDQERQRREQTEAALWQGRDDLRDGDPARAEKVLSEGLALVDESSDDSGLAEQLRQELGRVRHARNAAEVHALADRLRLRYGGSRARADELAALRPRWEQVWARRARLMSRDASGPGRLPARQLETDLLDLGLVWADLCAGVGSAAARREALRVLDETEAMFGPSVVLCRQRQACAAVLGLTEAARNAAGRADGLAPRSAWEHYALGRLLLQEGKLEEAAPQLGKAVEQRPQDFWPNFYQGVCAYRRGRPAEAEAAFRVGIALAPAKAEAYYHRALARAAQGDDEGAIQDYGQALARDPRLGEAALNRGVLEYRQQRYAAALADLNQALDCGCAPARVHYTLALIHLARQDRELARASVERALEADPRYPGAAQLWAALVRGKS
jgi:serine/threonine protein kinase/tetratricopeptide (TPR) repeat protein